MKKTTIKVMFLIITLSSYNGYSQKSTIYNTIETKDVKYYAVEEIINMKFGGTTTRYTVSDLSLINTYDLGPNNIRIITPIYKNENFAKKNYYVETKNSDPDLGVTQKPNNLTQIKIDSKKIEIPENQKMEKVSLAVAIQSILKSETTEVVEPVRTETTVIAKPIKIDEKIEFVKNLPKRESSDHININIMDTYERVADKGYKSIFLFKELGNYFYFNKQMEKAVKWYEELFIMTSEVEPVIYFRFGDALKKTGDEKRGEVLIQKFNKLTE
ncbi:tetratricopeptide repeat protein [Flavobacterium sp.]|uniref:tetratricopeptide repeat protein n=1 Tax=Flavobacterium sp. TaxID=239 RepID=UPI003C4BCC41